MSNRLIRGGGPRHERRAGQHALTMELRNGAIHALRKAKIIRIDDQTPHRTSLSTEGTLAGEGARLASQSHLRWYDLREAPVALPPSVGG